MDGHDQDILMSTHDHKELSMTRLAYCLMALLALGFVPHLQAGGLANRAVKKASENFHQALADAPVFSVDGQQLDGKALASKKYIAVYFSAHWCPPCRKFTPQLSAWYEKNKGPDFELIFASSDKSDKARAEYMSWGKMTFPYLEFKNKVKNQIMQTLGLKGIPCIVVFDKDGNVVASSYQDGKYVGPQAPLTALEKLLTSSKT